MSRQRITLLIAVLVVCANLWLSFGEAKAWWGCGLLECPAWCPGWDCGWWYLGIRPGPIRRLLFGPYRWYWSPYACCWVGCCGQCCWEPWFCPPVGRPEVSPRDKELRKEAAPAGPPEQAPGGGQPATLPATPGPATDNLDLPQPPLGQETGPPGHPPLLTEQHLTLGPDAAEIVMSVPSDARIKINSFLTRSRGSWRRYVSYGLLPGNQYRYEIEVEVLREGRLLRHTETVFLQAGKRVELAVWVPLDRSGLLASLR